MLDRIITLHNTGQELSSGDELVPHISNISKKITNDKHNNQTDYGSSITLSSIAPANQMQEKNQEIKLSKGGGKCLVRVPQKSFPHLLRMTPFRSLNLFSTSTKTHNTPEHSQKQV